MAVFQWILGELNVKENAPRWAGLVVAGFSGWLAQSGVDITSEQKIALAVVVAGVITTAVQKLATLPR